MRLKGKTRDGCADPFAWRVRITGAAVTVVREFYLFVWRERVREGEMHYVGL